MPRIFATLLAVVVAAPGCSVKWNQEGLCFKPLFRVRVEVNRNTNGEAGHHGDADCECIDGGTIDGGIIDGGMAPGAFVTGGPLTVETEPLTGAPVLQGALTDNLLSASPAGVAATNPAPAFGPNFNQPAAATPPSSTGTGTQQTAKKRPAALMVSTGPARDQPSVLRVGQRAIFGVLVGNTGELPVEATQLQGTFTPNLKPVSILMRTGPSAENMHVATSTARIEGQRVIFDKFTQLGPETMYEFQVTCEVTAAGAGNFEVTNLEGPSIKKNTPTTATAQ